MVEHGQDPDDGVVFELAHAGEQVGRDVLADMNPHRRMVAAEPRRRPRRAPPDVRITLPARCVLT